MNLKVVVIEDDDNSRNMLKIYLESLGCEVSTSSEPMLCEVYQGHDCSKSGPCGDAMLTDYNMPGMTGLEFIELLINRGCKGSATDMLLMSGNTENIDMKRANATGCTTISKPFRLKYIKEWLEDVERRKYA